MITITITLEMKSNTLLITLEVLCKIAMLYSTQF